MFNERMMTKISRGDSPRPPGFRPGLGRVLKEFEDSKPDGLNLCAIAAICFVCLWSLLELPWEFKAGSGYEEIAALLLSKIILLGLAVFSIRGGRLARYAFLLICLMSVLAVASEIPLEYERSRGLALLSTIECLGKLLAFITVVLLILRNRTSTLREKKKSPPFSR